MKRYGLRDDQFARIEILLPGRPGTVGRNSDGGNHLFVEAVIWKFRQERRGETCRSGSGLGKTSTPVSHAGPKAAFGRVFSKPWQMTPTMNTR